MNSKLAKATHAMANNIEEPLSVEQLAAKAEISTRQLTRLFQKEFGVSPGAYYNDLRLKHARELIVKTRCPISDIALASGYASAAWFSRAFKTKFSVSPTEARSGRHLLPNAP